ncbi:hypothetical protein AGMMS50229_19590 [Campylobacterota bacterium]|nr:hypothetical protein AGMMS50229_19590 [Campylobacterota bacterium]
MLEPNLNPSGMTFACILILGFMLTNIAVNRGDTVQSVDTLRLEQILTIRSWNAEKDKEKKFSLAAQVPGFRPFLALSATANEILAPGRSLEKTIRRVKTNSSDSPEPVSLLLLLPEQTLPETAVPNSGPADTFISENVSVIDVPASSETFRPASFWLELAVILCVGISQIAVALGLIYIGHCHFNNFFTGISAATLYFLLPYTNQMTGRLDHVIPAALIVWGVGMYRRPLFSGMCFGLAGTLVYYPIFLVPLWCSFYWRRGMIRYLTGVVAVVFLFYGLLFFSPEKYGTYHEQFVNMLGFGTIFADAPGGLWEFYSPSYRIPMMAVFFVFCFGLIIWPSRKNLATLIACSVILLLGLQSWQTYQGGLYMAWYLPLLLLTFFRPNLEDRVAVATVIDF